MERFVSVHVTDLCNEKCNFCVVESPLFTRSEVRDEDIWEFLRLYAGRGYSAVNLHGGEPTVYPRLLELLEYISDLGYAEVHVQTNARRLHDRRVAEGLAARGVTLAIISLHGATAEVHDRLISTPGGFAQTVSGIRHAKQVGMRVRTNIVVTSVNLPTLAQYAELVQSLRVDHVNVSNLHPVGSGYFSFARLAPNLNEVEPAIATLVASLTAGAIPVTLEGFPFCACPSLAELQLEAQPRDVPLLWKGRVIESYDEFMDEGRVKHDDCRRCVFVDRCGGVYREYVEQRGWYGLRPVEPSAAL